MGISLAWVSVRGKGTELVFHELHLVPNGKKGNFFDFPVAGINGVDGTCIITAMRCDHVIIQEETLKSLSKNCTLVACAVEEHVNYSYAAEWKNGEKDWSVEHQGDIAPDHLIVIGVPENLAALRDDMPKDDPEVDYYFDIPLLLAKELTGFKHDENWPGNDKEFQQLDFVNAKTKKPRWKFW